MTSFVFRVRNIPAALYKALGGFATNGVNMSKLESYMVDGEFTATQFYAEVDGHPEDPGLARALDELGYLLPRAAGDRHLPGPPVPRGRAAGGGVGPAYSRRITRSTPDPTRSPAGSPRLSASGS